MQQVILEVTGNCNLRCEYCIYNEGYEENRNFNSENMSKETAFVAIDYLTEHGSEEVALAFCEWGTLVKVFFNKGMHRICSKSIK
ncbi:MAG: hypothetical protein ACLUKE_00745 [Blautia wexlerae]